MACLEMYNSNGGGAPMSPRISFSNDFVEIRPETTKTTRSSPLSKQESSSSSDNFEFSVSNYTMMPADELFSKGKLLPFKETNQAQRTLREELLVEEEDEEQSPRDGTNIFSLKPPIFSSSSSSSSSSKGRWKGLLGLKRAHVGSKNNEERFVHMVNNNKQSQAAMGGREGSSCRDMKKSM